MHKRRYRVAQVSLGLDMGGKERVMLELARHCDRRRLELQIVSLGNRGTLANHFDRTGCTVHAMNCPSGFKPSLIYRLGRLFRENHIDVVHTHDDRSAVHGLPAALLAGIRRRIHTHHHSHVLYGTALKIHMLAWAGRLATDFVCVSRNGADVMRTHGIPAPRLKVVYNGVDLDRFSFCGSNAAGPALTVARLSPEKDLAALLHAVARLVGSVADFRLEIAGDGPSRVELLLLARSLGIAEHVTFLGERSDIPELLSRARLFVLPSQTEGLSLTLLEAMSRGLPVVATRVGGTPEVVVDGKTGVLVSAGDAAGLAEAVRQVWSNADLAFSFGRAGRERVERDFEIARAVAQYEALYLNGVAGELRAP